MVYNGKENVIHFPHSKEKQGYTITINKRRYRLMSILHTVAKKPIVDCRGRVLTRDLDDLYKQSGLIKNEKSYAKFA